MKLSAHCNITNPETAGYPYLESIKSFANLCDEVIVVDGGTTDGSLEKIERIDKVRIIQGEKWERTFDWLIMPRNLQKGFEACKGDWAFHFDVDYIFHEDNAEVLKELIEKTHLPAIELRKTNFVMVNENYIKDYYPLLIFKSEYKTIGYGVGKDEKGHKSGSFLRPVIKKGIRKDGLMEGETLRMSTARVERSDIDVFTYDFTFMTQEQVRENRFRIENSFRKFAGLPQISEDLVFKRFIDMMRERHIKCRGHRGIKLEKHSKFIRDKVKNITPDMFGYNMWGLYLED